MGNDVIWEYEINLVKCKKELNYEFIFFIELYFKIVE